MVSRPKCSLMRLLNIARDVAERIKSDKVFQYFGPRDVRELARHVL